MAVLAFDGVVLSDLATPCDVFGRVRDSNGLPPYDVRVCGLRRKVTCEHLGLQLQCPLTTLRRADTIVVPGIYPLDRHVSEELIRELRRAIARGARVASICTGAFLLARTGALNGLKATTHWLATDEGKRVVLYFYPRADTPGCTIEACEFRDGIRAFGKKGAAVAGVSPDKPSAQAKFKEKYDLPFTLLADEEKAAAQAYGVWKEKNLYGKKVMGIARTTFVIGPDGKIEKIYDSVKAKGHAAQVLADLG